MVKRIITIIFQHHNYIIKLERGGLNSEECRPIKEQTVKNSGLVTRRSKSMAEEDSDKLLKEALG